MPKSRTGPMHEEVDEARRDQTSLDPSPVKTGPPTPRAPDPPERREAGGRPARGRRLLQVGQIGRNPPLTEPHLSSTEPAPLPRRCGDERRPWGDRHAPQGTTTKARGGRAGDGAGHQLGEHRMRPITRGRGWQRRERARGSEE
eukprot:102089-Prorocentrum_minimum.AAC.1